MVELLYNIFVYSYNVGEKSLSFDRIKRLLSNNISDFENNKLNYNFLFQLLNLGIIDKTEKNKYSLSNTILITNSRSRITLGVNIPEQILKANNNLILQQYLGLTIFKSENINFYDYEIIKMVYDLEKSISMLQPIKSIVKNWKPTTYNDLGQITKIEKYNQKECKWNSVKDINENISLYKFYINNDNYFKYLFKYSGKYFLIEPSEYEKINTLKLINSNKSLFKYDKISNEIKLKPYHTYPIYLNKILLLNHIMETEGIPTNNNFKIELKQFIKIAKTFNLNYTIE